MRRLLVFAVVCLSAMANASVSVSGNLQDLTGTAVTSRTFVRFIIRGCAGNQARFTGTASLTPNYQDFTPDNTGAFAGTLFDSMTEISCGGSVGNTWYGVVIYRDGKPGPEVSYNVTGASFNLNSATPNTTSPVVSAPTGDSTYVRLDGGNNPTGTISPSTNGTLALGGSSARWDLFANAIDANAQFTSSVATGTAPFSIASTTKVSNLNVDQVDGGDWAAPLPIGTGTPAAGTFTTLTGNTSVTSPIFKSNTANAASSGIVRLANTDAINFRNFANGADDNLISSDSSDRTVVGVGTLRVSAAAATATVDAPGNLVVKSAANHGSVSVQAGASTSGAGGSVTLVATDATSGVGGSITLTTGAGAAAANGSVKLNGLIGQYGGTATAGQGVTWIPCVTSQKSESASDTNVLTCATPAAIGTYRVRFTMAVSAQNTATLGWTATWTDANGSAHSPTNLSLLKVGTAAPALTFVAATNDNYYGYVDVDTDASAAAIVVKLTFAGTSFTALATASVERIN